MADYKKHNLVSNYGYEIYQADGTLRERYMPEPEASCEGTLDLEIKDQNGKIKQKDSVPIRSLQRGIIAQIFSSAGSSTSNESAYRFQNRWFYSPQSGQWPQSGSNIMSGSCSPYGGIFVCNQSSSGTNKTCSFMGSDNINESFVSMSSVSDPLHYDNDSGTIKISLTRANVQPGSGSASKIALIGSQSNDARYVYAMDSLSSSWAQNDSIRITYNFEFPTSASSTITKNMLVDWFTNFDTSMRLKNLSGTDVACRNTSPSLTICGCKYIYGASANQIDKGIVLGTSDADVSWEDTDFTDSVFDVNVLKPLATSAADFTGEIVSGTTVYCQHARNFQNISDHAVTIKEAGVITHPTNTTYCVASVDSFLLAHWLTGDVVVNPGETIRVYWKPTIIVD